MKKLNLNKIHITSDMKYRAIFLSAGAIHIFFLIFFIAIGQIPMVLFNAASTLMYVVGGFVSVPKGSDKIGYGWILAFFIEITLHAVVTSLVMGWEACFHLYVTAILPVAAYLLFLTCSIQRFLVTMAAMTLTVIIAMGCTMWYLNYYESFFQAPGSFLRVIAFINSFFVCTIVFVFTMLFVLEVGSMLSKLDAANRNLEYIATHDALTGLYNRHSLKKLYKELEQSNKPYCIALGDIDDFKKVNDTYGHDCGDVVLKSVAGVISNNIGENDAACRWGGEEMLIVMWGDQDSCLDAVSAIKDKINALRITSDDKQVCVSMTFGFVDRTEGKSGIEALISVADSRLYVGKKSGKNVIVAQNVSRH